MIERVSSCIKVGGQNSRLTNSFNRKFLARQYIFDQLFFPKQQQQIPAVFTVCADPHKETETHGETYFFKRNLAFL